MKSAVADSENNTPLPGEETGHPVPAQRYGRKPTFKNIRTLTEAEVEALKAKQTP